MLIRDGGVIAEGYDDELDDLAQSPKTRTNTWSTSRNVNANEPASRR